MSKLVGQYYIGEGFPLQKVDVTCCERWQAEIKRLSKIWKLGKELVGIFSHTHADIWTTIPAGFNEEPPFLYCPECGEKLEKKK